MSEVSTRFTAALSNLKSRDDRKRRRAVRELFEMDDENNLSAFIPLLSDRDSWYCSKALDALLSDLKEHPKRYVHFSIFGRKDLLIHDEPENVKIMSLLAH